MRSIRFSSLILLLALVAPGCQRLNPVQSLTTLGENAEKIGSARMLMTVNMKLDFGGVPNTMGVPSDITLNSEGVVDFQNRTGQTVMKLGEYAAKVGAPPGAVNDVTIVYQENYIYYQIPEGLSSQFQGKEWVKLDSTAFQSRIGTDPTSAGGSQPQTFFEFFNSVEEADIEKVGSEEIRGVDTTHFRVKLGLEDFYGSVNAETRTQLIEQAQKAGFEMRPSDVWIDKDGYARKVIISMGSSGAQGSFEMAMTMELFDFGTKVEVSIPPDNEVLVADDPSVLGPLFGQSSASGSSSSQSGGSSGGPPPPAPSGGYGY